MGKGRRIILILLYLLFLAGAGVFCYPILRGQYLDQKTSAAAEAFLQERGEFGTPTEKTSLEEEKNALWEDSAAYNQRIWEEKQAGLIGPESYEMPSLILADYGLENEIYAVLEIPVLDLTIPIYLGASEENLSRGAAHLTQSSLPIGGANTNCVLAGHRGWQNGTYFHNIDQLKPGDEIRITNRWETLTYHVTESRTIEAYDSSQIRIREGRDLVTLLTCCYAAGGYKMRLAVICERE